jgi:hypothetical protein
MLLTNVSAIVKSSSSTKGDGEMPFLLSGLDGLANAGSGAIAATRRAIDDLRTQYSGWDLIA